VLTEYQNIRAYELLAEPLQAVDVLHAYNMELHPVVGYISSKYDIPSVGTLNSYHFFPETISNKSPSAIRRLYELVAMPTTNRILVENVKKIDKLLSLSEATKSIYVEQGFDAATIDVVPNMMNPGFEISRNESTGDRYTLLYVGSLEHIKGVDYLIEMMSHLPADFKLNVVGSGSQGPRLKALVQDKGLSGQIEFRGWVPPDAVSDEYSMADLFVHPGIWPEPFGRTLLEASQAGLPIVCSNVGGPPEIIDDPDLVFEAGDVRSMAEVVANIREQSHGIGARNREHVENNYSSTSVIRRVVDVYEELAVNA
jgi:glycosyltransferase involved in cell wall biosynthesis